MDNLVEIYVNVDDFLKIFQSELTKKLLQHGEKIRNRPSRMSRSEIITVIILFHRSNYRTFKHFYLNQVYKYLQQDFPTLVSYTQFVKLQKSILIHICAYLNSIKGKQTGISFIDSTPIAVCHNKRIARNKVFNGLAARAKSTMGWYYGFKLHIIINEVGELLSFALTSANIDDRKVLSKLSKDLTGKLFGDRGYISQKYFDLLFKQGLHLITTIKKNMKNKFIPMMDKILLRKRFIIETVNDQLKNISQIEHSRHRSINNFMVNLIAGLVAYCHQSKKPAIKGLLKSQF